MYGAYALNARKRRKSDLSPMQLSNYTLCWSMAGPCALIVPPPWWMRNISRNILLSTNFEIVHYADRSNHRIR
jgi:hypothetical protein